MRTLELKKLNPEEREAVLAIYRRALKRPEQRMSYYECALVYGFRPDTIRHLVHRKRLRTTGRWPRRSITHAAMRAYLAGRKPNGSKRIALKEAQTALA